MTPRTLTQHDQQGGNLVAKTINWSGDLNNIRSLVVHEDNHLLALYKPSSVLMQGDMQNADNLLDAAKRYLRYITPDEAPCFSNPTMPYLFLYFMFYFCFFSDKYAKPGSAYLGLVHRLDRVTSGISVFAKTSKAAARLSELFKTRNVIKYYLCVVNGEVAQEYGECNHLMTKTKETDKKTLILPLDSKRRDTVTGVLRYRVVHRLQYAGLQSAKAPKRTGQTLLAVELETGRKHQIRAQLAHIGHPIVGDVRYGAPQRFPSRDIALHAAVLSFPHPTTLEPVRVVYLLAFVHCYS
jgi:23S rRNA pseudouridine1911/1915/1917 synthase